MGSPIPWHRIRPLAIILALVAVLVIPGGTSAQQATPAAGPFADLGLPELDITVTATGYEGIPDQIEAGRYLLTVTATEDTTDLGVVPSRCSSHLKACRPRTTSRRSSFLPTRALTRPRSMLARRRLPPRMNRR